MAAPGVKRSSRPVLPTSSEPAERKRPAHDPAREAAFAATTAALVVGSKCEARFQASLNVKWKTFWFPGVVDAVNPDGTYNVRFDDGDFEPNVKRRFMRLPRSGRRRLGAPSSSARNHEEQRLGDGDDDDGYYYAVGGDDERGDYDDELVNEAELYELYDDDISALVTTGGLDY